MVVLLAAVPAVSAPKPEWKIGTPFVGYYWGPGFEGRPLIEEEVAKLVEGGWNTVWCKAADLDVAHRLGLRAILLVGESWPSDAADEEKRAKFDALIDRVKDHPAMYAYWITDEPSAARFPELAGLVAYLRERDPAHMAFINLFPTYATNEQLGNKGDTVTAYNEHLRQYVDTVKPDLISYDHYHFQAGGKDGDQYFLNLSMVRKSAMEAGVPFVNTIQACTWTPVMRVPNGNELRWLTYTSLAYGADGISHYVYYYPTGHEGMMVDHDGRRTPLYYAAKRLNKEFVNIGKQLQTLQSIGAYHTGTVPMGAEALPDNAAFTIDPATTPAEGMLLGYFGRRGRATHVLVVNLNYKQKVKTTLTGPGSLERFELASETWKPVEADRVELELEPGGGALLRLSGSQWK